MKRVCTYTGADVASAMGLVHLLREHEMLDDVYEKFPQITEIAKNAVITFRGDIEVVVEETEVMHGSPASSDD